MGPVDYTRDECLHVCNGHEAKYLPGFGVDGIQLFKWFLHVCLMGKSWVLNDSRHLMFGKVLLCMSHGLHDGFAFGPKLPGHMALCHRSGASRDHLFLVLLLLVIMMF